MPKFLHAYCGRTTRQRTTKLFSTPEWEEVKLDPNAAIQPDIVGDLLDTSKLEDASFDALFTARSLEHMYAHDVDKVLTNAFKLLKPEGHIVIIGADIEEACLRATQGRLLEKAYDSPAGTVTPLDILYGFRPALAAGKYVYACRTGFTTKSMAATLSRAGFSAVWTSRNPDTFTLFAIAAKQRAASKQLRELAREHFG